MKIINPLHVILFATALLFPPFSDIRGAELGKPNVILILADDLGYGELGCYGGPVKTPHIDRLAAEGVRCTDGYAAFPVCSPSRAAILTGRYPQRFGPTYEDYFGHGSPELDPAKHVTIGQLMKEANYRTGCFGKWNVSNMNRTPANAFGFDTWVGLHLNHDFYTHKLVANSEHDLFRDGKPFDRKGVWSDTIFADEAIQFIKAGNEKPFFIFLPFQAPHDPIQDPDEPFAARLSIKDPKNRPVLVKMIERLDTEVGRVLQALDEAKLADNTLVILTSDNGGTPILGRNLPLNGAKQELLEGGIRVPMILRWPTVLPAGKEFFTPVTAMDLAATVVGAGGVKLDPATPFDGIDLVPVLTGKAEIPADRPIFFRRRVVAVSKGENAIRQAAVRQGDWKLLRTYKPLGSGRYQTALYNLKDDLGEKCNLADSHPVQVGNLSKLLDQWEMETAKTALPFPGQNATKPFGGSQSKQTAKKEAPSPDGHFQIAEIFSSDMVLQREVLVPVWGQAPNGTVVTVSFQGKEFATTSETGQWRVNLPPLPASTEPVEMTVSAHLTSGVETRCFTNILVGDVWFASGQSNMAMQLPEAAGGVEAVAESNNLHLRHFIVPRPDTPVAKAKNEWKISNPKTAQSQSAVGYFFASEIQKKLGIPIGLINCSYGGTVTETWCPPEVMKKDWPAWETSRQQALKNPEAPIRNTQSSYLYERMVQPLTSFPVKGFLWYQGEGNASRAEEQQQLLPEMIRGWRRAWGNERLPFFFVQLARYEAADWHAFRCAQLDVWKSTPDTFMAVTIDLSKEPGNHPIHPKAKKPIGHRLALAARAKVYGETDLIHSGPIVREAAINNDAVLLSFDHAGSGLASSDGEALRGFFLSPDGKTFSAASAVIESTSVVLRSPNVPMPVAVRYGAEADMGRKELDVNVSNKEGLPASPFMIRVDQTPQPPR